MDPLLIFALGEGRKQLARNDAGNDRAHLDYVQLAIDREGGRSNSALLATLEATIHSIEDGLDEKSVMERIARISTLIEAAEIRPLTVIELGWLDHVFEEWPNYMAWARNSASAT